MTTSTPTLVNYVEFPDNSTLYLVAADVISYEDLLTIQGMFVNGQDFTEAQYEVWGRFTTAVENKSVLKLTLPYYLNDAVNIVQFGMLL